MKTKKKFLNMKCHLITKSELKSNNVIIPNLTLV